MDPTWIVLPLGVVAGALTTVAGVGGGLLATLVLAAAWDPHAALAVTAPALLMGNAHRLWLFRRELDPRAGAWLAGPALLGAVGGGLLTAALPDGVLRWLLLGVSALALVRERGRASWVPGGRPLLMAGGLLVGFVTAAAGGGGLLLAPLLLAAGLRGARLIAAGALVGVTIHVARISTYGGTGLLGSAELPAAIALGTAILLGNTLGRRLRPRLGEARCHRITWITLLSGVGLAVLGLGRS